MGTAKNFIIFFLLLLFKSPFPSSHTPEAEEAPTQSADLSSGLGCMLQADRAVGQAPSYGDDMERRPKLANEGERKGLGKSLEIK